MNINSEKNIQNIKSKKCKQEFCDFLMCGGSKPFLVCCDFSG